MFFHNLSLTKPQLKVLTEDGRSMTTFYYQSGLQRNTFSKLSYIFLINQNVPQIKSFHLRYMMFHRSKDFEAKKAGKLAIQPWLRCQYNKNTLVDLPSSMKVPQNCVKEIFCNSQLLDFLPTVHLNQNLN